MKHVSGVANGILLRLYKQRCGDVHRLATMLRESREVLQSVDAIIDVSGTIRRCDDTLADFVVLVAKEEPISEELGENPIG